MADILARVLKAWELLRDKEPLPPRAPQSEFDELLRRGIVLPDQLDRLYCVHNGASLLGGNLTLYPLVKADEPFCVTNLGNFLRLSGWPVPTDLLLFGDNGQCESFGVWLDTGKPPSTAPVVEIGAIFEPDSLAIKATSLYRFLLGWSSYYAITMDEPGQVLDALHLPPEVRQADDDEELMDRIWRWADPDLPSDYARDPYKDRLTPAAVDRWVAAFR